MKDFDENNMPVEVFEETGEMSSVWYDPVKDLHPVDPYGFINLADAYINHSVPTVVADEVANYNGIDDPESILGTPHDIFEAYRMNEHIRSVDKQVSSSDEDKTS